MTLLDGSGVNREVHASFYERPGVQFRRPIRQILPSVAAIAMAFVGASFIFAPQAIGIGAVPATPPTR
jgi:hypothetical protein